MIRSPESVDRLLGIPHEEEVFRAAAFRGCEPTKGVPLEWVRVLEFIHEDVLHRPLYGVGLRATEIVRFYDQIVVGEAAAAPLFVFKARCRVACHIQEEPRPLKGFEFSVE